MFTLQRNSNFLLRQKGVSSRGASIIVIKLVNNTSMAFRYNENSNVVITDTYDDSDPSFRFEISPVNPTNVCFVYDNVCSDLDM